MNKAERNASVGVTNRSFSGHNGTRQAMAELTEVIYSAKQRQSDSSDGSGIASAWTSSKLCSLTVSRPVYRPDM